MISNLLLILLFLILGMIVGIKCKIGERVMAVNRRLVSLSIYILLFIMGLKIGNNKEIFASIPSLGLYALILCIGAMTGSFLLVHFFVKEKKEKSEF